MLWSVFYEDPVVICSIVQSHRSDINTLTQSRVWASSCLKTSTNWDLYLSLLFCSSVSHILGQWSGDNSCLKSILCLCWGPLLVYQPEFIFGWIRYLSSSALALPFWSRYATQPLRHSATQPLALASPLGFRLFSARPPLTQKSTDARDFSRRSTGRMFQASTSPGSLIYSQ